jgi:hypothetical protein
MLRHLTVERYVTPLREGGSLPAVVETDGGCFVVKFRGAGQGPAALVAEVIAGELARAAGLPVPEIALVDMAATFARQEPHAEIRDLLAKSAGLNMGMAFLPGAITYDPAADPPPAPALASAIVWLDAYLTNVDRTPRNTNLLVWQDGLWLIDHGATLYFHHSWAGYEERIDAPFAAIASHVLLPYATDIEGADTGMAPCLTEDVIGAVLAAVPDEWLDSYGPFPSPAEHRAAYAHYLTARLAGPRPFVAEVRRARTHLV